MSEERDRALEAAMAQIKKEYGDGAVMRLGEASHLAVEVIPTGSLALDRALGVGGIPRGRVSEIFGPARPPITSQSCDTLKFLFSTSASLENASKYLWIW